MFPFAVAIGARKWGSSPTFHMTLRKGAEMRDESPYIRSGGIKHGGRK